MKIAIIPARGGSKRIPQKNIKLFNGKPIIAYSIAAARQANCFDQIIVSTDDPAIAEVAIAYGATVPFIRPATIANDHATIMDVMRHALDWLESHGCSPQFLCTLYATAPLLDPQDLLATLNIMQTQTDRDYCLALADYPFPIQRAVNLTADRRIQMFEPQYQTTRSQDLVPAFHDAGQFCWGRAEAYKANRPIFSAQTYGYLIDRKRVIDIDTLEDWEFALQLFHAFNQQQTAKHE